MAKKRPMKKRSDFATAKAYQAYKVRSAASKQGWKKRKVSAPIGRLIDLGAKGKFYGVIDGKSVTIPPPPKNLTIDQMKELLEQMESRLHAEIMTRGFVDSTDIEYLHKDMTIALEPSRLRHLGKVTDQMERMLKIAAKKGKRALRKQAKAFAEYFDVPLREVYTLFISP